MQKFKTSRDSPFAEAIALGANHPMLRSEPTDGGKFAALLLLQALKDNATSIDVYIGAELYIHYFVSGRWYECLPTPREHVSDFRAALLAHFGVPRSTTSSQQAAQTVIPAISSEFTFTLRLEKVADYERISLGILRNSSQR